MKKLITILLLIPFWLNAQIDEKHFVGGAIVSSIVNIETYNLIKDTQLKPWQSKLIALSSGIVFGTLAGHLKEKHDNYYNKKDLKSTFYGALTGSFTIRILIWNSIPESHVPIEDLWMLENIPLVKR